MNNVETADIADLKERILLSAIKEFGYRGYSAASTNAIVQDAGVSKGLLFHYYGNKEKLFSACVDYVFRQIGEYFREHLGFPDADIFDRMKFWLRVKMDFCRDNPLLMGLAIKLWDTGYRQEVAQFIQDLTGAVPDGESRRYASEFPEVSYALLIKDADVAKYDNDVELERVVDYVWILLNACWDRYSDLYNDDPYRIAESIEEYLAEADVILDLIRRGAAAQ